MKINYAKEFKLSQKSVWIMSLEGSKNIETIAFVPSSDSWWIYISPKLLN
jgi:hypothetical protein